MANDRLGAVDYERVMKILSEMELSKPVALVTISQKTGIKLADIIRYCSVLESINVIRQLRDSGNIFYTLLKDDYDKSVEDTFLPKEEPAPVKSSIDSRQAILQRRKSMREAAAAAQERENNKDSATFARNPRPNNSPEPISAVDLLAMRRSGMNMPLSRGRFANTAPVGKVTNMPSMDRSSSTSHKAIYMNTGRNVAARTSFSSMSMGTDALGLERSDTNFKQVRPEERQPLFSIIPESVSAHSNHEVSAQDVFDKLNITANTPLLTVLSPRPTYEVWEACSALANSGGGILILGMRKYIQNGEVTYFIKTVNNPDDAIKRLMSSFNDRETISDCPKDSTFISVAEFGRKKVLVLNISPVLFTSMPLYLSRDSYGMRTDQGCYIYRDGEAQRCTEEETKSLWMKYRLNGETPDWDQTGELLPVKMEHKIKVSLPPLMDDSVRPLSQKDCHYGQPIAREDIRFSRRYMASDEPLKHEFRNPPVPERAPESVVPAEPALEPENKVVAAQELPFKSNDISSPETEMESSYQDRRRAEAQERNTLQYLLFAEDIRTSPVSGKSREPVAQDVQKLQLEAFSSVKTANPVSQSEAYSPEKPTVSTPEPQKTTIVPPDLAHADRSVIDEIIEPALSHPRLPSARLCEIAATLLKTVRLSPLELSDLLKRKLPVIRTKVFPTLKETYKFHLVDNKYYIE